MIVVGILVSLVLLALIIRFALSKQTDKPVKRAAIIALAVIGLSLVICLIVIATGSKAVKAEPVFTGFSLEEPVELTNPNTVYVLLLGVIMALFVGLVIFLAIRDRRKRQ
ncbi:hypothetical protein FACS1894137_09800 [Spirochaetia bacterium]|nr:hypothetical protein FACS1894137_09800 [Spirochaetia bacterium]